jgi:hypothetical protein
VNSKDFFKINLPEAAALANSAESLHTRDQDEVDFEASTDLLLRINSLVLAALSSRQNYSAKQIRNQLHIKICTDYGCAIVRIRYRGCLLRALIKGQVVQDRISNNYTQEDEAQHGLSLYSLSG